MQRDQICQVLLKWLEIIIIFSNKRLAASQHFISWVTVITIYWFYVHDFFLWLYTASSFTFIHLSNICISLYFSLKRQKTPLTHIFYATWISKDKLHRPPKIPNLQTRSSSGRAIKQKTFIPHRPKRKRTSRLNTKVDIFIATDSA